MSRRSLLDPGVKTALAAAAGAGAVVFLLGLKADPHRAMADLLLANVYFIMLAAAAMAFVAIQNLAGAGWPVLFRRVPEAMSAYLPVGAVLMLAVLAGSGVLYHWAHPESLVHDELLHAKSGYLNLKGWTLRTAVALAAWWVFSRALVLHSRRQDLDGDIEHTHRAKRLSAAFLVVFGITFTLASIDWVMSLEPHWYSTIFPWYMFGGAFVQAVAGIALLTVLLHGRGLFREFNDAHRHDLGKYLFAFGVFWAYLWFCQFLLIWYSNIPEEIAYYAARRSRGWLSVQALSLGANFLVPGILLLAASAKKNAGLLAVGCVSLCAGRWLDLYTMIMPSVSASARPSWIDLPVFLGVAGLFILVFDRAFAAAEPVALKDPYLSESLHHHG